MTNYLLALSQLVPRRTTAGDIRTTTVAIKTKQNFMHTQKRLQLRRTVANVNNFVYIIRHFNETHMHAAPFYRVDCNALAYYMLYSYAAGAVAHFNRNKAIYSQLSASLFTATITALPSRGGGGLPPPQKTKLLEITRAIYST